MLCELLLGLIVEGGAELVPGGLLISGQSGALGLEELFPDSPEGLEEVSLNEDIERQPMYLPQGGVESSADVSVDGVTNVGSEDVLLKRLLRAFGGKANRQSLTLSYVLARTFTARSRPVPSLSNLQTARSVWKLLGTKVIPLTSRSCRRRLRRSSRRP